MGNQEIVRISDYKDNNKVVQSNDLIRQTRGSLNIVPLKMFKLLISCIDTEDPPEDYSVYVKRSDFLSFSNANSKGDYAYLKKQLDKLICAVDLVDSEGKQATVSLLARHDWKEGNELVKCTFDRDVWKYLVNLKEMFLQYEILQIKEFNSKFSVILYENLLALSRQYGSKNIAIETKTLRRLTGTEKKYGAFKDFDKNVLKVAQDEINGSQYVEFLFTYDKKRKGHAVEEVIFKLRRRTSLWDTIDHVEYPERLEQDI